MPEMTLEWGIKQAGLDPKTDMTVDTSIAFAAMQGVFVGGTGDFVTLFDDSDIVWKCNIYIILSSYLFNYIINDF